jgi:hypothetical protein
MIDPCYCWEVYLRASHALATGKGEIKERLLEAALEISPLDSRQMPDQLRTEHEQLLIALSTRGTIRNTLATMRKDKAKSLAERIWNMERTLCETCYEQP